MSSDTSIQFTPDIVVSALFPAFAIIVIIRRTLIRSTAIFPFLITFKWCYINLQVLRIKWCLLGNY